MHAIIQNVTRETVNFCTKKIIKKNRGVWQSAATACGTTGLLLNHADNKHDHVSHRCVCLQLAKVDNSVSSKQRNHYTALKSTRTTVAWNPGRISGHESRWRALHRFYAFALNTLSEVRKHQLILGKKNDKNAWIRNESRRAGTEDGTVFHNATRQWTKLLKLCNCNFWEQNTGYHKVWKVKPNRMFDDSHFS